MILFFGDSFTWGQGLYFEKWLNDNKSIDFINNHSTEKHFHENFSFEDNQYRITHSYPHLVSQKLNLNYFCPKFTNGGSNYDIIYNIDTLPKYTSSVVTHIIIQLTAFSRCVYGDKFMKYFHDELPESKKPLDWYIKNNSAEGLSEKIMIYQIRKLKEVLDNYKKDVKILVFSWHELEGKFASNIFEDSFMKINYNDNEYFGFQPLLEEYSLSNQFNINDEHLSSEGHRILAEKIINKLNNNG